MDQLHNIIKEGRAEGLKLIFTNGVFDILHRGHVTYLNEAKKLGDLLIVGVNSDESVRRLNKGPERPVNDQDSRSYVLSNLKAVDSVVIFDGDTPIDLIKLIEPDFLVKGGDYDPNEKDPKSKRYIVGSDFVRSYGGQVVSIDLVDGFSTTNIIKKLSK